MLQAKGGVMFAHQVIEDMRNKDFHGQADYCLNMLATAHIIKTAHCFHIGEISDVLAMFKNEDRKIFIDNAKYIKLPYDVCWFDAIVANDPNCSKFGCLIFFNKKVNNIIEAYLFSFMPVWKRWVLLPLQYYFSLGKKLTMDTINHMFPEHNTPIKCHTKDGQLSNMLVQVLAKEFPANNYVNVNNIARKFLTITENAITLLNCKNITTESHEAPIPLNKARKKAGKQELFTYKTLKIIVPSDKKENQRYIGDTANHNRIHFCRGHFKEYTAEHPLFGRVTGLYWWQPHVRGQNKNGIVMKDYVVIPRRNE
jgi:hypothetical protein